MRAKIPATLLLILTLSPFTAPFPICDLATLVAATIPGTSRAADPRSQRASLADTSISQVRPLQRAVGRIRLTALFPLRAASSGGDWPSVALGRLIAFSRVPTPLVSRPILRI